jgi:hypothetical protein
MDQFIHQNSITISAGSASMISVLFGYPFDSIKTRMQVQYYPSTWSCMKTVYSAEGLAGFYRGVLPVLGTISIFRSMAFSVYHAAKMHLDSSSSLVKYSLSGALAGGFVAVISQPIDFIKVQRQLEAGNSPKSSFQWAKYIIHHHGITGLFKGFHLHLAREMFGTAVYFSVYETFKGYFAESKPWIHMLSGGLAGTCCWLVLFPIDMTKSVYQKNSMIEGKRQNIREWILTQWRSKGFKGFYQGIGPQLIRSFPGIVAYKN